MTIQEFSDQFDVLYNNITSNQAPGLNEYEKSVFLTKAEKEIVKNYFSAGSMGNTLKQGYDDSAKRQADFSVLMNTSICNLLSPPASNVTPRLYIFTLVDSEESVTLDDVTFTNTETFETETLPDGEYYCLRQTTTLQTLYNGVLYNITSSGNLDVPTVTSWLRIMSNANDRIDPRSGIWSFPSDVFIVINEAIYTNKGKILQLIPLRYDEYT